MRPRSLASLAFEKFWISLRRDGALLPARSDFNPADATGFLYNIILLEAPGEGRNSLKVRVAGQRYQNSVPFTVAGRDHLETLPAKYHAGAIASARLIVEKPCGLWQVMPVCNQNHTLVHEFTAFPLAPGSDGIPLILGFILPLEELELASPPLDQVFSVGTAAEFCFIDVGAGQPEWPDKVA